MRPCVYPEQTPTIQVHSYSYAPLLLDARWTRLDMSLKKVPQNDPRLLQRRQLPGRKHPNHVTVSRADLGLVNGAPERHLRDEKKKWQQYSGNRNKSEGSR